MEKYAQQILALATGKPEVTGLFMGAVVKQLVFAIIVPVQIDGENQGNVPTPVLTGLHAVPPAARWSKTMPVEFLHGRPLNPDELEMLRQQIEEGFDNIAEGDPEIRGIVARNWPYRLEKLPPEDR